MNATDWDIPKVGQSDPWADWLEGLRRWRAANRRFDYALACAGLLVIFGACAFSVSYFPPPWGSFFSGMAICMGPGAAIWQFVRMAAEHETAARWLARLPETTGERDRIRTAGRWVSTGAVLYASAIVTAVVAGSSWLPRWMSAVSTVLTIVSPFVGMLCHVRGTGGLLDSTERVASRNGFPTWLLAFRSIRVMGFLPWMVVVLAGGLWFVKGFPNADEVQGGAILGLSYLCGVPMLLLRHVMTVVLLGKLIEMLEPMVVTDAPQVPAYRVGAESVKPANPDG